MNRRDRTQKAFSAIVLVVLMLALPSHAEQPIRYNHNAHVVKAGIDCVKCHSGVTSRARAGLPPDVFCQACHTPPRGNSPEEARLIKLLASGKPLAWRPVTHLAPYVYFSHRRHVGIANIECATCHGEMSERTEPPESPFINFNGQSGMNRCKSCHQASHNPYAGTGCVDCHR